jgi:hypothetical protein
MPFGRRGGSQGKPKMCAECGSVVRAGILERVAKLSLSPMGSLTVYATGRSHAACSLLQEVSIIVVVGAQDLISEIRDRSCEESNEELLFFFAVERTRGE